MISLLAIGLGMFVIGIGLMMVRNNLRRAGNIQAELANQVLREGLRICCAGLIILLVGVFLNPLSNPEAAVIMGTGASLMYVGLLSLVQWTVQSGRGTEHQVHIGARVVIRVGVGLVVVYAILRFIGVQF